MSGFSLKEKQSQTLIRDGLASEVFFGRVDGDSLDASEIENISPIISALLSERSLSAYRAILFMDALARQFDYYIELATCKEEESQFTRIRTPLYLPLDVVEILEKTKTTSKMIGNSHEEEIIEWGHAKFFELHNFLNEKCIDSFSSYLTAKGVMDGSSNSFFRKASENKKECSLYFNDFMKKIRFSEGKLKEYIELLRMNEILKHIETERMNNAVLPATDEEEKLMENFLSKQVNGQDSRMIYTDRVNDFYFSPLAKERPSGTLNFIIPEQLYTFADLLIYTDVLFKDSKKLEIANQIRIYNETIGNEAFGEQLSHLLLVGKKYEEAYEKNGLSKNAEEAIEKSYRAEIYNSMFEIYANEVKSNGTTLLENILKKEHEKPIHVSLYSAQDESFSFKLAGYVIKKSMTEKISFLPLQKKGSLYRKIQKSKLRELVYELTKNFIEIYMEERSKYIQKKTSSGEDIKDMSKANRPIDEESEGSQVKNEAKKEEINENKNKEQDTTEEANDESGKEKGTILNKNSALFSSMSGEEEETVEETTDINKIDDLLL